MAGVGVKILIILVENFLASGNVHIPTVLTQLFLCSKEEFLDPSLLDEEDIPMSAGGLNEDIPLEDYLDDANDAFDAQANDGGLALVLYRNFRFRISAEFR